MAAVTADRLTDTRNLNNKSTEVIAITTSNTVYVGALVNIVSSTGRVASATAAASRRPGGIVEAILNDSGAVISAGTGNTAGTIKARVAWGHEVLVNVLTAARTFANLGKNVFIADNASVTDTTAAGTATLRVKLGMLTQFGASTATGWVALRVYGDADAV